MNKFRISVISILLLFSCSGFAQTDANQKVKFFFQLGIASSFLPKTLVPYPTPYLNTSHNLNDTGATSYIHDRFGITIGFGFNIHLKNRLSLKTEIQYTLKGVEEYHDNGVVQRKSGSLFHGVKNTYGYHINYLLVPLSLQYSIPVFKNHSLNPGGGMYVAYAIASSYAYNYFYPKSGLSSPIDNVDENYDRYSLNIPYNKLDIGLNLSVSYLFPVNDNYYVGIEPYYQQGFIPVFYKTGGGSNMTYGVRAITYF